MTHWRFIPLLEASGKVQMAIDSWLLQQYREGKQPPCLRFYTWFPVTISLGYHQRHYPAFWQQLHWAGNPVEIVRRPTGGRAVLHQGDLTYMVITSQIGYQRQEIYEKLCQFLIEGLRSLGLDLDYGKGGRGYIHQPNCFGTATKADLVDNQGNKFIGSAQLRQGKAILQHGSMRLFADSDLFEQVFAESAPKLVNLLPYLSQQELILSIITALTKAASQCFEVELVCQPLSESEWLAIKTLITE